MKLVLISDTHMQMSKITLPEGDLLIHAGDHSYCGTISEMTESVKQLAEKGKNFKNIIMICGNHDWLGEKNPTLMAQICKDNGVTYLDHSSAFVDGLHVFGSAYTPEFYNWAFNVPRGRKLAAKWTHIPKEADVVITHGPVKGILDLCPDGSGVGCEDLFNRLMIVKPKLHVSGHIHHSYGVQHFDGITFVNASICDEQYKPTNKPVEIDL